MFTTGCLAYWSLSSEAVPAACVRGLVVIHEQTTFLGVQFKVLFAGSALVFTVTLYCLSLSDVLRYRREHRIMHLAGIFHSTTVLRSQGLFVSSPQWKCKH